MTVSSDSPPAITPRTDALATVVNSVGEKLSAALIRTSVSDQIESRRKIERVLGRRLEPRFALELLTLLLDHGNEGRELRAAFLRLMDMADSVQWAARSMPASSAPPGSDEANFLAGDESAAVRDFARCGECLARTAPELEGKTVSSEQAASLQWALCARCRSGTDAWYPR
jgi:hypothetical protein